MNGYPYPSRPFPANSNGPGIMAMGPDAMDTYDAQESQSLDDIVSQNNKANRRQSIPVYARAQHQHMHLQSPESRRLSMLSFGDPNARDMDGFQFDMSPSTAMDGMMRTSTSFPRTASAMHNPRNTPAGLAINTQFANNTSPYGAMPAPPSAYASPMHPDVALDMDMSPYPTNMNMPLDMDDSLNMMPADMNMYQNNQFNSPMMGSPLNPDVVRPMPVPRQDANMSAMQPRDRFKSESQSATPEARSVSGPPAHLSRSSSQDQSSICSTSRPQSVQHSSSKGADFPTQMSITSLKNQQPVAQNPEIDLPRDKLDKLQNLVNNNLPWATPQGGFPSTMNSNPHMKTQFKNAYSSTGFDMLGVLIRVATRQNPQIDIGSVDLSCAFVVCDASMDDVPIVYCSDNFERLTGYTKHMILGRNCRFLQSPDGKVESGVKRKYVDDDSVLYLKNTITARTEAQISLINYRRGGQPFMNLLTMIPIPWEPGGPIKFFVGFQVDLVEQPGAMTNKNADGSFRVNYQRGMSMPSYVFNDVQKPMPEQGQTISKDEVSNVLATYGGSGDSEITRRIWDKVLLENTDDVVHVLSLKGLFMYLSPSSNRILEYEPSELIGTALSSVCHPSDIVPVTRELKETSNGGSVNVVFRIRRKKSGYMWFEGHGSLHTEQGKGRKCIILVGRERPVYTLSKAIVRESGGIGDNELWTKMSTSGMFLFVSSNVRQLLDKQPEDLVGTSIQALMRQESKVNFGRILELARGGRKGEVKHEMINKRGQVLQAFTTIYPGDATEGQKPTFVVGQTRLLKYSRNSTNSRPSMYTTKDRNAGGSQNPASTVFSGASPMHGSASGQNTPVTASTDARFVTTEECPATYAGHNGLRLGHQDQTLASDDNVFDELKTTRSTSWQYELRQMEKRNRYLAEEVQTLLAAKKKRKRRKGTGQMQKDCANCHTRTTPEWRRGPSGKRDLCNSCGLRWAKQQGRVSPRTSSAASDKSRKSASPRHYPNHQTLMPNVISETGQTSSIPSTLAPPSKRSPEQGGIGDIHAAKAARLEAAASQGFIPQPKIDEGIEPLDE
ncbi:blue light regulator 1 [Dothidotthia symphoricarpi CBS 119687]|uniref:Blue light regulator 1 n=1 Tax=Dothidotthia symphoricarpi CBS 119687 TaxID=1392245 RepID=A0A6A6ADW5_9PLEO|nr:blue light regulator 1 [Dothidotthia symphoricarpi CBS 119687]KAF2129756.1 blue light regulator 1 [Dothidotthia symphoricarpi CBS 119687]